MSKIGIHLVTNIIVTALPLKWTEPLMKIFNPRLRERLRVLDYDPESYQQVDWERTAIVSKRDLLREARISREATGTFSVKVGNSRPINDATSVS